MNKQSPRIEMNLAAITENARVIVDRCRNFGCRVVGVTKACCGDPLVARAMLNGGVSMLGDSRLANIRRMRQGGIGAGFMLLRIPMLSEVAEVVDLADVSLNSEIEVVKALSECAVSRGKSHRVVLMVDLGDLREGVWPDSLIKSAQQIKALPGVQLEGIGTNLACYGGVIPDRENMKKLIRLCEEVSRALGCPVPVVSGGNSANLQMVWQGQMPEGVSQLRIGEGILLGKETVQRLDMPGLRQDAFRLLAEIVELKEKPSVPIGKTGQDAMGGVPSFRDRGIRHRAILAIGRQDVHTDSLTPCLPNIDIVGASSDHLIVDVTDSDIPWRVGMEISFKLNYLSLISAMVSPYVKKIVKE